MAGFYRDDNAAALVDPTGLRPTFGTAGIVQCTMTSSTQELTIPVATSGQVNGQGQRMVMITTSAQPAYIAFDAAGAGASYTGPTNMMLIPANAWMGMPISALDKSIYVQQAGTAGPLCLTVLKTAQ